MIDSIYKIRGVWVLEKRLLKYFMVSYIAGGVSCGNSAYI